MSVSRLFRLVFSGQHLTGSQRSQRAVGRRNGHAGFPFESCSPGALNRSFLALLCSRKNASQSCRVNSLSLPSLPFAHIVTIVLGGSGGRVGVSAAAQLFQPRKQEVPSYIQEFRGSTNARLMVQCSSVA